MKILYIQHAEGLGGSCASLLYTMQGVRSAGSEPILALARPTDSVVRYYRAHGFDPVLWDGIGTWQVSNSAVGPGSAVVNAIGALKIACRWASSERRTLELVEVVKPDIVHLNSVVLAPSARALFKRGIRFVWHVREQPVRGVMAWQAGIASRMMMQFGSEIIFISGADRDAWVRGRRGQVVYNFVDFERFDQRTIDGESVRREFGIEPQAPVVLYVGGLIRAKGAADMFGALEMLKSRHRNIYCLAPGSVYQEPTGTAVRVARWLLPRVGWGTYSQRVEQTVERSLRRNVIRLPFRPDIERFMAAADVVVFPATIPHFARPVIEAGAMGKPVIASRLDGLEELVQDGVTGILIPPCDRRALAEAIDEVLCDRERARRMGAAGYERASRLFSAKQNAAAIKAVYERVLGEDS